MQSNQKNDGLTVNNPEAYAVAETVSFNPDRGTSTLVHSNGRSKVFVMALGEGQSLNEHKTPLDTFFLLLEGTLVFEMGDKEFHLKAGDAFDIPGEAPHRVRAITDSKFLLVH